MPKAIKTMIYKKRGLLDCDTPCRATLERIVKSKRAEKRHVQRATIFLRYMDGVRINAIAKEVGLSRQSVYEAIDKALIFGPLEGLKDLSGRGAPARISEEDKAWVLSIACQSPRQLGYAHELWTIDLLAQHVRKHCENYHFPSLKRAGKSLIHGILSKANIKPHKVRYYLERRDEGFETKMAEVLSVYKEVEIINAQKDIPAQERKMTTISYDEKPGIQAIKNMAAQLLPVVGSHPTISRDYEYKRLGTLSLLAGIDLHNGRVIPLVEDRHRSIEFIQFLEKLNQSYPEDWKIRLILDNHSSHRSKQTMEYLKSVPGRFEFTFTPKHGSWLNLIEIYFSKIARSFLRQIRVDSIQELKERIYQGIEESNKEPVLFKWTYKLNENTTLESHLI